MSKRVTITDIAKRVGVSGGTVHRALQNKSGVGEALRARIVEVARECGYQPNIVASSLKRRPLRVVFSFPGLTDRNRYFYTYIWQGFRDYLAEVRDYKLDIVELPFYEGSSDQAHELNAILDRYPEGIDGLLTVGPLTERGEPAIARFAEKGIPIVLACDDLPGIDRLACVVVDHDSTGRMMAEQLFGQIGPEGRVLLLAGDMLVPAHYGVVRGFESYMAENGIRNEVSKAYGYWNMDELRSRVLDALRRAEGLAAVCCVCARVSAVLGDLLREAGLAGKVRAIGSDVFEESLRELKDGVFTNIVYKNPYRQAYLATRLLMNYLIKGEKPANRTNYVETVMVFRSNLAHYQRGYYRENL